MNKPQPGTPAPDFTAPLVTSSSTAESSESVTLSQLKEKPVILYFYPKDDTPGCTKQACGLRDAWHLFKERAEVFGISVDSTASHSKFIKKYELPFALISDVDTKIAQAYGVWVEKSMYGKKFMGVERSTFVIGKDGIIKAVLSKVKPEKHVEQVLAALDAS